MLTSEPTVYTFRVPEGTVTATVCAALQYTDQDRTLVPVVRLDGKVRVFALAYGFRVSYQWDPIDRPVHVQGYDTDARTHWVECERHPYNRSYWTRAKTGRDAPLASPSRDAMDVIVFTCLARLQADHPQWQQQSLILHAQDLVEEAREYAAERRQVAAAALVAAEAADARAVELAAEAARMAAEL